jgi:hypothetical protein
MVDWKTDSKKFDKMTKEELDKYHHTPETELSLLVCRATDRNDYAQLKEYLQVAYCLSCCFTFLYYTL